MTTKNYQLPPLCNIPIEIQEKAQKDGISPIHTNLNKSVDLNNPSFRAIFVKDQIWTRDGYVNIDFVSGSAWSYVGRTSYHDSTSVTTMNLGFMYMPTTSFTVDGKTFEPSLWLNDPDMRVTDEFKGVVVMHEFGHTCGMMHEHQNGLEGKPIDINYDVLYSRNNGIFEYDCPNTSCKCDRGNNPQPPNTPDCSCSPGGCNCSCEANYFQRMYGNVGNVYSGSAFEGSDFDNKSVMLYGLPNQVIVGCENVPNGQYCANNPTYQRSTGYSPTDKEFLDNFYDSNNTPTITVTFKSGPEWKQYWVKKVLQDYLNPIVGIKFNVCIGGTCSIIEDDTTSAPIAPAPIAPAPTAPAPIITKSPTAPAPTKKPNPGTEGTLNGGEIAGIVIGSIIGALLFLYVMYRFFKRRRRRS